MIARLFAINFGIAIIFPLLIYYGVSTFSPAPKWNDYHEQIVYTPNASHDELVARQQKQKAENDAFADASRAFSLRLLCVAAPLGYAAILLGASRLVAVFGPGLMFGGIFAVTDGYWSHWSFLPDWTRFLSLLLALAVLVLVSYWRYGMIQKSDEKATSS